MNYERLYNIFIDYCRVTPPTQRIERRNKHDERLFQDHLYLEKHHIIPRHNGGRDTDENLVVLLPEEHYLAHLIRFKAYNDRNDFLAIRFMVNGYNNSERKLLIPKKVTSKIIGRFKQKIYYFRKKNTWHTDDGIQRISRARTGKVSVVDSITKEVIGSIDRNHPNIISGKWVHHTKGMLSAISIETGKTVRLTTSEYRNNKELYKPLLDTSGEANQNFSGFSDDDLINLYYEFCGKLISLGSSIIPSYSTSIRYHRSIGVYVPITYTKFRFNGNYDQCVRDMHDEMSKKYKLPLMKIRSNKDIKYINDLIRRLKLNDNN
jgi:hypothetical protein